MHPIVIASALLASAPIAASAVAQEVSNVAPEDGEFDPDQLAASARRVAEQAKTPPKVNVFDGDYVIVGLGVAGLPDYEGSDKLRAAPAAGAIGRFGGIGFRLRGPSLTTDLIDDPSGARIGYRLGPSLRYRANRTGHIGDDVVARLGKLKAAVDAGLGAGVNFRKVLSKQDTLSLGASARWDLAGRSGMTASASMSYLLPVSRAHVFGMQVSGEFMDDEYADYNFTVTPEGSAASGLPAYRAKGGFKELNLGAFTARDLNGNFLDGGFAIGAGAMYSRLYGSAARSPITSLRGSRNQWLLAAGVAYTF